VGTPVRAQMPGSLGAGQANVTFSREEPTRVS
jgi:hypothetical protein